MAFRLLRVEANLLRFGYRRIRGLLLCCLLSWVPSNSEPPAGAYHRHAAQNGISISLDVEQVVPSNSPNAHFQEGDDVRFKFTIADSTSGSPLRGAVPAAWLDLDGKAGNELAVCGDRVKTLVSGSLFSRAEVDLNAYYVLALNEDSTITVVDPLFGYGSTKLLAMVPLNSPGNDWVLTPDQKRLFVSLPDSNEVAVVNTALWKMETAVAAGVHPSRLALQPDAHYLWVMDGGKSPGVVVLDANNLSVAARITTGIGPHEIAFTEDDQTAFVTNAGDGTVSLIDIRVLKNIQNIPTGSQPDSIAYSALSKKMYITNSGNGSITVVDSRRKTAVGEIQAAAGINQIRFARGGRLGFVASPDKNVVLILDATSDRVVQTVDVENGPDQITFSDKLAYIRQRKSETVYMIPLETAGTPGARVPLVDFPAGQHPLGGGANPSSADSIVGAPGENSVLVANPLDKTIYFYKEGMAAPMGSFFNYSHQPRAVIVVDRSLKQKAPGAFETVTKLPHAGSYTVALLLDAPRLMECFSMRVESNPALEKVRRPVHIEALFASGEIPTGAPVQLRFLVTDSETHQPKADLKDFEAVTFLSPGVWHERKQMSAAGDGIYEFSFVPPKPGIYRVSLECLSQGVSFRNGFSTSLKAVAVDGKAVQ
jgi:YVTN family beta-propeller protein